MTLNSTATASPKPTKPPRITKAKKSLGVWLFTLGDFRSRPMLLSAFADGKPFDLANKPLPPEVKTAIGCDEKFVIKKFKSVGDIFFQRKAKVPRHAALDMLSPDGRTLAISIDFDD